MFRYMYPLTKVVKKELLVNGWDRNYPKEQDIVWKVLNDGGKYIETIEKPFMDLNMVNVNEKNIETFSNKSFIF